MASNTCMNSSCRATSSIEWRKGWGLRSGGFANLCDKCWSTYEQLVFCDTFHLKESGWRECISCGRRLHCGCIASKSFLELLDNGGVECISCVKNSDLSSVRVARQPVDGRGRNQLLPRYWPRITDQELQQISGASNSTIVPLFEKVLSASDAGRIGRLVLPKACAEAYFPRISQPEGLPLKIQDAKGNEWLFQFRFWPNNNSRMYVLEGVAPCIQSMQLQAGDTVTFSRIDPERKLVIGFRKAFNTMTMQSSRGSTNMHLSALSKPLSSADGDVSLRQTEKQTTKNGDWPNESFPMQPLLVPEKKRSRNIGSKSKRLVIDSEDALELKLTWEEAQDLLCPPPTVKPSIVMIEGYEFEEYDEPPVFGKKTIFTSRTSGEQDQWAQCDSCSRWRRLPANVLLPPKWSCADNDWDPKRCSCSAPDEISPTELDNLLRLSKDFKKRKIAATQKTAQECEPSALEALATAAVLGDDRDESGTPSVLTTTKHPRHRSGCTCIVCIQPPSGKGPKHKPTCTCNVCKTVKRRFETFMTRKKKCQSAHDDDIPQRKFHTWGDPKDEEADIESASNCTPLELLENEVKQATKSEPNRKIRAATNKGQIDLNCHPCHEDDVQADSAQVSMTSLVQEASLPLEMYLKYNGLTSLSMCEQQVYSSSHAEGQRPDKGNLTSVAEEEEEEEGGDKVYCESD